MHLNIKISDTLVNIMKPFSISLNHCYVHTYNIYESNIVIKR